MSQSEVHRLTISLNQTEDKEADIARLYKLVGILKSSPGPDRVNLRIINGEKIYNLDLPTIYAMYSAELKEKLAEVVGQEGLKLETVK